MRFMPGTALPVLTGLVLVWSALAPSHTMAQGGSSEQAQINCAEIAAAIPQAPAPERYELAMTTIKGNCRPIPEVVLSALTTGKWQDGQRVGTEQRTSLLTAAVSASYAEAESLAVTILENGVWPDDLALDLMTGGQIVGSLQPVLTPYRVRLLLDVYEQIRHDHVRSQVLRTLRGSTDDASLLPALDSFWGTSRELQQIAVTTLAEQPEEVPGQVLGRLIRNLPEGPLLNWALSLARQNPSSHVAAARRDRGL